MKKWWVMPVLAALLFSLTGPTALAAGSASVSISSYTKVQQSRSYTYTITVKVTSSIDFIGSIKFSGIFSHDPIFIDHHMSSNTTKTYTNKVTFKIPSSAAIGSTGVITVTGQGSYLDDSGNVKEYSKSGSRTATVIAYVASTPKPTTAATKKPTAKPTASPSPTATPEPNEWDTALQSATSLTNGGALNVDVAKTPEMPVSLLASLKDKQGKLTVNLGGGSTCAIDGAKLGNVPAEGAIDLSMSMEKDAALSQKAGGADIYQMKFAHSGPLPGPFAYTFKAASSKPGDTLYLYYYYDESGVMEGLQSAVVDDAGNVTFTIYHCSAYIVTAAPIEGAAGSLSDAAAARLQAQEAQAGLDEAQAQLTAEKEGKSQLEGQLTEAQGKATQLEGQLKDYQEGNAANEARAAGTLTVPYIVLAGGAAAVAVISILLTYLICRKGSAKKKKEEVKAGA